MKTLKLKASVAVIAAGLMCCIAGSAAHAQGKGTVAVCPATFDHGTKTARMAAMKTIEHMLQHDGYSVILPAEGAAPLASRDDMMRYGSQNKAQFILKPTIRFHSRSIWVDLGPRTNSSADVDIVVTDAATGNPVYTRDAKARSDEKFDVGKAAADVFFTPVVTIVSGGPKAPHEERAAKIAVYRALSGWTNYN